MTTAFRWSRFRGDLPKKKRTIMLYDSDKTWIAETVEEVVRRVFDEMIEQRGGDPTDASTEPIKTALREVLEETVVEEKESTVAAELEGIIELASTVIAEHGLSCRCLSCQVEKKLEALLEQIR